MNENLEELKIDEEGNHRPRGKNESDHNTIIAKFKVQADKTTTTKPRWSINKNTNWEKYNEIIEDLVNAIQMGRRRAYDPVSGWMYC